MLDPRAARNTQHESLMAAEHTHKHKVHSTQADLAERSGLPLEEKVIVKSMRPRCFYSSQPGVVTLAARGAAAAAAASTAAGRDLHER